MGGKLSSMNNGITAVLLKRRWNEREGGSTNIIAILHFVINLQDESEKKYNFFFSFFFFSFAFLFFSFLFFFKEKNGLYLGKVSFNPKRAGLFWPISQPRGGRIPPPPLRSRKPIKHTISLTFLWVRANSGTDPWSAFNTTECIYSCILMWFWQQIWVSAWRSVCSMIVSESEPWNSE